MIKHKINYLFFLFIILCLMCSCANQNTVDKKTPAITEKLQISVTVSPSAGYSKIKADDISPDFPVDIQIHNLTDLQITIDGTQTTLESALQQELITPEEIFAFAQIDARKGNCDMEITALDGLTYHIFTYPMYDLAVVYDILEASDGKQHLIHTIDFDMAYTYKLEDKAFLYFDDTTGEVLNRGD